MIKSYKPKKFMKKRSTKKSYAKKRKFGTNKISTAKFYGKAGFPDEIMIKLSYVESGTFASGVPTPNGQVYLANSLFDPNSTGTGHQPLYFDQCAALYGKYLVLGCAYDLELTNGASSGAYVVVCFNETDISGRNVESLSETRYSNRCCIGPIGGISNKNMKGYLSMGKLHGQKHIDQDPNQYSTVTGSPTDGAFLIIKATSVDGTNVNLSWRIHITYYCKFKDLQNPTQS